MWTTPNPRSRNAIRVVLFVALVAFAIYSQLGPRSPDSSRPASPTEYGGNPAVYSEIRSETDCDRLQEMFDIAAANNDRATPGTSEHRYTLGYMQAANDRMSAIGCY